ncbi:MAG: hypothetical protein SGI73_03865 [Chloroflexota bacterium]|nr:hypothetical protein [Chloroflexota bacterium]
MSFTYYTEKSVAQALTAINERLQAKSGRDLNGWIDKSGTFSLIASTKVAGAFNRSTSLSGKIERTGGQTVVTFNVSEGVPNEGRALVFVALALVGLMFFSGGNTLLALAILPVALTLYVLMKGDHDNSILLKREIQRVLSAKTTPIKKADGAPKSVRPISTTKAAAARPKSATSRTPVKPKP